jgi:hypothetical protein
VKQLQGPFYIEKAGKLVRILHKDEAHGVVSACLLTRAELEAAVAYATEDEPMPYAAELTCAVEGCGNGLRISSERPFEIGAEPWKCSEHDPSVSFWARPVRLP